ncbi:MAG: hypothetical protein M1355_02875 [Patescibacteria group bacterium]|nr:hypothetical protein [Patescibacteria group bacterium]
MKKKEFIPFIIIVIPLIALVVAKRLYPELLVFDNLMSSLENLYRQHGVLILFAAGLLESLFLINFYVPGATVILLGGVLASTGAISLPAVILAGTSGLVLGYSINYAIGRFGWYKILSKFKIYRFVDLAREKIGKGKLVFWWGTIHPNMGSFLSIAAGTMKFDFWIFLILVAAFQLFWSSFWGLIMFFLGYVALKSISNLTFAVLLAIITIWIFRKILGRKKKDPFDDF